MNPTPYRVLSTKNRFRKATSVRLAAGAVAASAAVGLVAGTGSAAAAPTAAGEPHKSYVCKYVSTPGVSERLQTGQNPIFVDNHALLGYDGTVTVGQQFKDGQIRSVVIVANTEKLNPEPTVADCPPPTPPTSTTTTRTTTTTTTTTSAPPTTTTSTTSTTSAPPTTTTSTTSTTSAPPTTTTATLVPPTTTHPTTTHPTTTHPTTTHPTTTHPSATTTTWATLSPAPTTMHPGSSTYPLQPVKAGVNKDGTAREVIVTPLRVALVLLVLFALWVAFGGRRPHVKRVGSPKDGS